eukprot:SAG31_NODE_1526_length_8004_cov_4.741176_7_plen_154_part_00
MHQQVRFILTMTENHICYLYIYAWFNSDSRPLRHYSDGAAATTEDVMMAVQLSVVSTGWTPAWRNVRWEISTVGSSSNTTSGSSSGSSSSDGRSQWDSVTGVKCDGTDIGRKDDQVVGWAVEEMAAGGSVLSITMPIVAREKWLSRCEIVAAP